MKLRKTREQIRKINRQTPKEPHNKLRDLQHSGQGNSLHASHLLARLQVIV